jgi:hypothetical protein
MAAFAPQKDFPQTVFCAEFVKTEQKEILLLL